MFLIFRSETETATFIPGCNEYHIKRDGHKQDIFSCRAFLPRGNQTRIHFADVAACSSVTEVLL